MPEFHGKAELPDGEIKETDGTLQECVRWADSFHWENGNIKITIRKNKKEEQQE